MNSKTKDIKAFIDELEGWIDNTNKDESVPYVLDVKKYENYKIVFSYFKKLTESLGGRFIYIDCQPESQKATLCLEVPGLNMAEEELTNFIGVATLYDGHKITSSNSKVLLLEVYINNMWRPVMKSDSVT